MTSDHHELDDVLDRGLSTYFKLLSGDHSGALGDIGAADAEREPTADPVLPPTLGRLELGSVLGRGGMGVVLRAHDPSLDRDVAVKVLRDPFDNDPDFVQRFVHEAVVSSQLQHPGIVPIYDIGRTDDDRPYYTMKIVDGDTLKDLIEAGSHPGAERSRLLEIFARVCETVAFAHARGVLHGDLKPSNVMVGAFGEVQVMDWGFAMALASGGRAPAKAVLGTLAYMAPEQARGDVDAIDARTDVFGLGGILCEILTGAPVYLGEERSEIQLRATKGWVDDALQRLRACEPDNALADIVRSCLSPDQDRRPPDAGAVSERIAEYLASVEERARALEIAAAQARATAGQERRARRLTVVAAVAIVVAVASAAGGYLSVQSEERAHAAEQARLAGASMERARVLLEEARRAPVGELGLWRDALAAAGQAVTAGRSSPDDSESAARSLHAEIEVGHGAAQRDQAMRAELEDIRLRSEENPVPRKLDRAYVAAFAAHGVPVDELTVDAATEGLRGSRIREEIVRGLDNWAVWRGRIAGVDLAAWRKLAAVAGGLDEDAARSEVRRTIAQLDADGLRALANSPMLRTAHAPALDLLATALVDLSEFELALSVYRSARRLRPDDFWIHHELASLLRRIEGKPNAEVIDLSWTCVSLRPRSAHAWTDLGVRLLQIPGGRDEGYVALRRAVEIDPAYTRAWGFLGGQMCAEGDLAPGLEALRKAAELAGDNHAVVTNTAIALEFDAFRPAEALGLYRRVAELRPDNPGVHVMRGACGLRLGHADEARESLRRSLALAPRDDRVRCLLARALLWGGRFGDAAGVLREADDPTRPPVSLWLAHVEALVAEGAEDVAQAQAAFYRDDAPAACDLFASAFERDAQHARERIGARPAALDAACAAAQAGRADKALSWLRFTVRALRSWWRAGELDAIELRDVLVELHARPELEAYRDEKARAALPGAQRRAWAQLWGEITTFSRQYRRR